MNLMQKLFVGAGLIGSLSLGCSKEKGNITGPDPEPEVARSYINFYAYWSDGDPAFVHVSLYEQFRDQRLLRGSTLPNGNFYSLRTYPINKNYEIFIYDVPSGKCIDNVLVAFQSNTPWPITLDDNEVKKNVNVGPKNPMRDLIGCKP